MARLAGSTMRRSFALLALLLLSSAAHAVPVDCSGTIVTGGTAVAAIAPNFIKGYRVFNLDTTEALWANPTGGAAAVGVVGSVPIAAGTATTFAGAGSLITSDTLMPNAGLSLNATTSGHKFTCFYW